MRLTVELKPEHHHALRSLALARGEADISEVVAEAIDTYLRERNDRDSRRERLLALAGALSSEDADDLRRATETVRQSWR